MFVVLMFLEYPSPLHTGSHMVVDSDIFTLAGKIWAEGGLPYVNFWDHKGPLVFWVNMISWKISGSRAGTFWLVVVLVALTMMILWKMVAAFYDSVFPSQFEKWLVLWIAFLWMGKLLAVAGWNRTETLCLPFLAAALLQAMKNGQAIDVRRDCSVWRSTAALLGLAFGVAAMTRLTNAVGACAVILAFIIYLLRERRWKNIGVCVVYFLLGAGSAILPFSVYFASKHAFSEMIYGTFLYNFTYASDFKSLLFAADFTTVISVLVIPAALCAIALARMLYSIKKHGVVATGQGVVDGMLLLSGILLLVLFSFSLPIKSYSVINVAYIPIIMGIISTQIKRQWRVTICILLIVQISLSCVYQYQSTNGDIEYKYTIIAELNKKSPDSIVLYNVPAIAYLEYNVKPYYKYAILQDWQASFSEDYKRRMVSTFANGNVEYIVVAKNIFSKEKLSIQQILNRNYKLVDVDYSTFLPTLVYKRIR